jgi:hypothetical protein
MPTVLSVDGSTSGQFKLSESSMPEYLQVSIFSGPASGIDPLSAPDQALLCTEDAVSPCSVLAAKDSLLISLSPDALPPDGHRVVSISAEYLAEPDLHSERFANLVNWVVELEPK